MDNPFYCHCFSAYIFEYYSTVIQILISFNAINTGLGIVAMIAIANESEPGFGIYYAGLMLVIIAIYSLFRLRFFYSLISSVIIILGYEATALFIQKIYTGTDN